MAHSAPDMIDMVFGLEGGMLSGDYPFALWAALAARLPALAEDEHVGVLPLHLSASSEGMLLTGRSRLSLRLPTALTDVARALSGQQLDIPGATLRLGDCKARAIQPHPTLHAQLVACADDEIVFMDSIQAQLAGMGVAGKMICGRRRTLAGLQQTIQGYSLVLHDLSPDASLRVQSAGMGEARRFGCGFFVPHKVISDLE
ncbi:MAG: type I-MYXAN CRISPR-associated protein Cas6/Cmx6 [Nitrosomonadales bacterium]|nr:type I-MYXAN CRISPR-associated protein Cas6/Cmx6 [Nitrosomonadales bacterium]